ncbi:phosphoenolpyruvate--protein phosphotransferase [Limosilactobacillus reuteri]|uniref:Phosphoenolpyruvate-protein phosphotransferase n=1 Tax=Limosilactobacillus reuteri TaxID=1598 RepID=A0AB73PGB0_LIMRT|nr:phosphoenolpyruvate--protein phosphotransferase [Limosilactobacillus reuteri]OYS90694.1 phosphoenolpyruvate--protein phosphotransferase [Limosilactobacillus reuteri]OYS90851.1 phosphoenolpyruvate--protein phosphotransferase [Limosilactobacillus reuteri]OYS93160.1 phosphoenolpyruvate--protein phosphotransferase [Limosilactobacillus reuteri]OYS96161.1 phosphoenolpyruvate--protein phosphotransferase [Limosilactobacillus reuteri]OYS97998.1 phosphoenolpyruvate--protein phosphotransferase [Limosi
METQINGIAASDGVGIAPAYLLTKPNLNFEKYHISDPNSEKARLHRAFDKIIQKLKETKEKLVDKLNAEDLAIFDTHIAILNDPEMIKQVENRITNQRLNAESAFTEVITKMIKTLQAMTGNEYMQERATDFQNIQDQVLAELEGKKLPNLRELDHPVIIVAHSIGPADTSQMDGRFVKGIITDLGGRTSHAAIMARSLQIPAIVGCNDITKKVQNGQRVIVDGFEGSAIIEPSTNDVKQYQKIADKFMNVRQQWKKMVNQPSVTADGQQYKISANIGSSVDISSAIENGADGVGLFRTEFLYMKSDHLPTEEEQFNAYRRAVEQLNGKRLVVRTLDIGGDKPLQFMPLPKEMNPFLGYRAIRIALDRPEMFRTQLRALLRASEFGKINIMFPMITTLEELQAAKNIYYEEQQKLAVDHPGIGRDVHLGIMIEVPLAALNAERLAAEVDFFSIGTNDLIQYCFAADRGNDSVSYLYQPLNPTFLKLIKHIIDAGHAHDTTVAMCGEMAGDRYALPLLIGMGLDIYSMSASSILRTRSMMKQLDSKKCQKLYQQAVTTCDSMTRVKQLVQNWLVTN